MALMKRKIVTRVVAALLVFSALFSLTGCEGLMFTVDGGGFGPYIPQAKYEEGSFSYQEGLYAMGIRSDTNEFKTDEVYFDLYVGFFDKDDGAQIDLYYPNTDYRQFGLLYLSSGSWSPISVDDKSKQSLYDLENKTVIKEFTQEETLTYGYSAKPFIGVVYDYKETIHIPEEFFVENSKKQELYIQLAVFSSTDGEQWSSDGTTYSFTLYYTFIDEETVRIRFSSNS